MSYPPPIVSSFSAPRRTILSASSANGRCNAFASFHGARIHTSRSSSVVRMTGIAFGWMGSTTAFGCVVRKPYTLCGPAIGFDFVPLSPLNSVQMPAKVHSGRSSFSANQTTSFFFVSGLGSGAYSAKLFSGTKHRFSGFNQPRQCGDDVLRMTVRKRKRGQSAWKVMAGQRSQPQRLASASMEGTAG